jgi:enterochelin esterase-like enzyme
VTAGKLLLIALVGCASPRPREAVPPEPSPCETALLAAPAAGPARFDAFLAEYTAAAPDARDELAARFIAGAGAFPIVDGRTVVFVARAPGATDVRVIGDFRAKSFFKIDWDPAGQPLAPVVAGGVLWFARVQLAPDARLDYQIAIDGKAAPDPLNPRTITSGIAGPASELVMPEIRRTPPRTGVPRGSLAVVAEPWAQPKVTVYLPPGYDANRRYPVIYTADGSAWLDLIQLPAILDDLIAAAAIEPAIAVMIDAAEDRSAWYQWNPAYLAYLDRVVGYVDGHYATRAEPKSRLHAGTSAGGRASLQVGLERPAVFANIAMLSPSLVAAPHVYEPYFSGRTPVPAGLRVWLSAGRYENAICEDTRMAARWLRGAKVVYTREGHSFGTWRHAAAEMLPYFLPR